ncbi:MAG: hypothetical protein ABWY10_12905, partial [Tardiphaga sp.]
GKFDSLGLGVENHDAILPVRSPGSIDSTRSPAGVMLQLRSFDLQAIRTQPQAKTPQDRQSLISNNSLSFK